MCARGIASLCLLSLACARPPAQGPSEGALSIAAAANLQPALEEVLAAFRTRHPLLQARATYGASGSLFAQIGSGAPFDLFLAADSRFPARLHERGRAEAPPFLYALGRLVVWVPAASPLDLDKDGLRALASPAVLRVAIGNPQVAPYGEAALQALEAAGLLPALSSKLVQGQSIAQAAQFAESGNAQAAFLPLSLAQAPPLSREGRSWRVPAASYRPIEQAGVVIKGAQGAAAARALQQFLAGPEGRALLEKHGYALPP